MLNFKKSFLVITTFSVDEISSNHVLLLQDLLSNMDSIIIILSSVSYYIFSHFELGH